MKRLGAQFEEISVKMLVTKRARSNRTFLIIETVILWMQPRPRKQTWNTYFLNKIPATTSYSFSAHHTGTNKYLKSDTTYEEHNT